MEAKDNQKQREEVYSIVVRAGKRTYYFDVKETRKKEKYLTITERKRRFNDDSGRFYYEKHKLFLYQEDFEKFSDGLAGVMEYIRDNPGLEEQQENETKSGIAETQRDFSRKEEPKTTDADMLDQSKDPDMPGGEDETDTEEEKF